MNMHTIKSVDGQEFVLLPARYYKKLETIINQMVIEDEEESHIASDDGGEYVPFVLEDYFKNPVALARINAGVTQETLAKLMNVSQAYISQLENTDKVSGEAILKVHAVLEKYQPRWPNKDKS